MAHWLDKTGALGIDRAWGLFDRIQKSVLDGDENFAAKVMAGDGDTTFYRIEIEEGVFFPLCGPDGRPRTILSCAEMKGVKRTRKMNKRYHDQSPMSAKTRRTGGRPRDDCRGRRLQI